GLRPACRPEAGGPDPATAPTSSPLPALKADQAALRPAAAVGWVEPAKPIISMPRRELTGFESLNPSYDFPLMDPHAGGTSALQTAPSAERHPRISPPALLYHRHDGGMGVDAANYRPGPRLRIGALSFIRIP